MTDIPLGSGSSLLANLWSQQRVWLVTALILAMTALLDPPQGLESLQFTVDACPNSTVFDRLHRLGSVCGRQRCR